RGDGRHHRPHRRAEPQPQRRGLHGLRRGPERARQAQEALAKGEDVRPLCGVPVLMKDLFDFKPGWPATFGGIPAMKDFTLDAYCVWAERMEAAGAIIVGKTNSP